MTEQNAESVSTEQGPRDVSICFISPWIYYYFPSCDAEGAGGAERQQYLISQHLIEEGFNVSCITRQYDDSSYFEQVNGIDVYKAIPEVTGIRNAPSKAVSFFLGLHRADADVYYVRCGTFFWVLTSLYCELFDKSIVYAAAVDKDVSPRLKNPNLILRALSNEAIKRADKVIVQTRHQQELLAQNHGRSAVVIPNGQHLPRASEVIDHEKREFVLWVGRIDREQKHPERYINIAEKLPGIRFVMIGVQQKSQEAYYKKVADRAEQVPNLDFVGYVPPDEIDDYYRRAFALVNTSDYEGFPNVFLEAWRYATPVISLHFSLGGEIEGNEIGRVSGDMSTLRKDIKEFVENTELRSRIGNKSREHVDQYYSLSKVSEKYRSVFYSTVEDM